MGVDLLHELVKSGSHVCTGGSQKRTDGPHNAKYSPTPWEDYFTAACIEYFAIMQRLRIMQNRENEKVC